MERITLLSTRRFGAAWFVGWLFTIGYLQLNFWWGLLGLIVWPYFLGSTLPLHPPSGLRQVKTGAGST